MRTPLAGKTRCPGCHQASLSPPPLHSPQLFFLEEQRRLRLQQLATLIQKTYRGWRCRAHYQLMRKSQIVISAWFRGSRVPLITTLPRGHPLALIREWEAGQLVQKMEFLSNSPVVFCSKRNNTGR